MYRYKKQFGTIKVKCLEYIVKPEDYLEEIEVKICKFVNSYDTKNFNLKKFSKELSKELRKNHIKFIPISEIIKGHDLFIEYGINGSRLLVDDYLTIQLFLNPLVKRIIDQRGSRNTFIEWVLLTIKHELIHRGQNLKIKDNKIQLEVAKKENTEDQKEYLAGKREIMSRAWEIVEMFRLAGYENREILNILASNRKEKLQILTLRVYHELFNISAPEMKLLYKYMYWYLED